MARYFFELSHSGDVYHDARGKELLGLKEAKERAFEIARRMLLNAKTSDIVCTVRDITGRQLLQIRVQCTVPAEIESMNRLQPGG
ncbi:hypothetical protein P9273_01130 [Mesorhizobium sp. WSM4935]|uniref:DUF6894 family protein n=1 Tax=Mesorhizobium sp. WSM4935 TaxID=3038547 RepID=UPI0024157014|nr:hypothetical protein [Mesorhizobium sp. WSM4935]MDG4873696.1 hypothetical protein [Mesorhizobium sp. WSM4935]